MSTRSRLATARALWVLFVGTGAWMGQGCGGPADEPGAALIDGGAVSSADGEIQVGAGDAASESGALPAGHCLDGVTDYGKAGPFTFKKRTSGLVRMWVPDVPKGCKVPMVHLANGTGGWCGVYAPSLERLASHGFLALCFESPITGSGDLGIIAFERALKLYPDLADYRFGSTGHSQGGQAAFVVLQYAEAKWGSKGVYAGLAMQPASGFGAQPLAGLWPQIYAKIKSPMFMFSGLGTDGLVVEPWVSLAYLALSSKVEKYHWAKLFSTHIPVPNREEQQISIPWFRWKLLGDKKACEAFKAIPKKDPTWLVQASKNVQSCD